eukprot:6238506-Amphidinium_carterae.1
MSGNDKLLEAFLWTGPTGGLFLTDPAHAAVYRAKLRDFLGRTAVEDKHRRLYGGFVIILRFEAIRTWESRLALLRRMLAQLDKG